MTNDSRNRRGRFAPSMATAERDQRIARMAAKRMTRDEIAAAEGCSRPTVDRAIRRVLSEWRLEGGEVLADSILNDLEAVYAELWQIVAFPGYKVSPSGSVVRNPETGEPMLNLDLRKDTLDGIRKVLTDMRALLGTDAPRRSVTATISLEADQAIEANATAIQSRLIELEDDNRRLRALVAPEHEPVEAEVVESGEEAA